MSEIVTIQIGGPHHLVQGELVHRKGVGGRYAVVRVGSREFFGKLVERLRMAQNCSLHARGEAVTLPTPPWDQEEDDG